MNRSLGPTIAENTKCKTPERKLSPSEELVTRANDLGNRFEILVTDLDNRLIPISRPSCPEVKPERDPMRDYPPLLSELRNALDYIEATIDRLKEVYECVDL